jgi:hypothetical protein
VPSERELGLQLVLARRRPELFEASRLAGGEAFERNVRQRRPAPEGERGLEKRRPRLRCGGLARLAHEPLEPAGIDCITLHLQDVARRVCDEYFGRELLPQIRDEVVKGADGGGGWILPPDVADQTVSGHDLARAQSQNRKKTTLLVPAQDESTAGDIDLERPEQSHFDTGHVTN